MDDFDGQPLPEGTEPVELTFDSLRCTIHLSAENIEKLREARKPFTVNAEVVQEPTEQPYGARDCAFRDPAGNQVRIQQI